ncbi:cytidine/deoxycytidylate deaminase family protein [Candidatus Hecatella orcuttiae]|jgi:dCMP deaminase|uniref:deoxycytidylate deaminase n=1 Tax=Candidatus Hecatella orcuttiae TaxID=1935119 RepID=UPI0028682D8A|nr:cytidine/deoxycytidylate deaminase family protein [Candidatus Hecatella orcuttiae]
MRPSKEEYYLAIASQVATRSTCLRRHYGAIIVRDDQIVSTGYNGAPRGLPNCIDLGYCIRKVRNIPPGERYEFCRGVHAEQNAIINAARAGVSVLKGTIYIAGRDADTGRALTENYLVPCRLCARMIINAGLQAAITPYRVFSVDHLAEIGELEKVD